MERNTDWCVTMGNEGTALHGTPDERRKRCARLLEQARADMLEKHPFVASLAFHLDLVPMFGTKSGSAQTDGKKAFFEVDFFLGLTPEERMGLVAHEVWHCAMRHIQRREERDKQRFNYACDIETDLILTADGFFEEMLPFQDDWVGQSAEWIYERISDELAALDSKDYHEYQVSKAACTLPMAENSDGDDVASSEQDADNEQDGGKNKSDRNASKGGNDNGGDENEQDKPSVPDGILEDREVDWEEVIEDAASKLNQAGKLPGHFSRFVPPDERKTLTWKTLLASYITMFVRGERDWLPPNRRYVSRGLYLPGRKKLPKMTLVLAIDTSGSTEEYIGMFVAELCALCSAFGEYEITVLQCDVCINDVKVYDNEHPLDASKIKIKGYGGTSLCPPFEYVATHSELQPQVFLYMTDGFGEAPSNRPPYPVFWCLTSDGKKPADWGLEIRLKDE